MLNINLEQITNLYKKYNIDWYINISNSKSKTLSYNPLYDEVSIDSNDFVSTNIVIIKNHKKAISSIDWFSYEQLELSINDLIWIVDFWEYDEDIILPDITDKIEKDFSTENIKNLDFSYFEKQLKTLQSFDFKENVKIESCSLWYSEIEYFYINSKWAFKVQKDNDAFYYFELFWENEDIRDNESEYKTFKKLPEITSENISTVQEKLLNKISKNDKKIDAGIYTISISNELMVDFIEIILDELYSESIREWTSLFSNYNIWDKIFSENFSILNNPYLPWYVWNTLFDREWITQKETMLFEKWVLKAKFYDYKNALKDWLENLWNSWVSNIEFVWETDENYLKNSKFLFTNIMWFHTIDTSTWKFSLNWEWFIIQNWEKTDFVKNVSISWDIINLLSNISSVWNDFLDKWNYKIPSMTFDNQNIV